MKKTNGLSALIKLTIAVVALSGLISAFLLRRSPDYSGSGKVLMTICIISVLVLLFEAIVFKNLTKKNITRLAAAISLSTQRLRYCGITSALLWIYSQQRRLTAGG